MSAIPSWESKGSTVVTGARAMRSCNITFSLTVRAGTRAYCWKTNPTRDRRISTSLRFGMFSTLSPSIATAPDVGFERPDRQCNKVDFPEPDGPTIEMNWPAGMFSVTFRRTSMGRLLFDAKDFTSPLALTEPAALMVVPPLSFGAAGVHICTPTAPRLLLRTNSSHPT